MRFYGITMEGKFINETLDTLPAFVQDRDRGRFVYLHNVGNPYIDGSLWYGSEERWIRIGGDTNGDGGSTFVEQISGGIVFNELDVLRWDGTEWVFALANDAETLGTHVVTQIVDDDHFVVAQSGRYTVTNSLSAGYYYFTSASTPGGINTRADVSIFSNPIIFCETPDVSGSTGVVHILPFRPTSTIPISGDLNTAAIALSGGGGSSSDPLALYKDGSRRFEGPNNLRMSGSDPGTKYKITFLADASSTVGGSSAYNGYDAVNINTLVEYLSDSPPGGGTHRHSYLYDSAKTTALINTDNASSRTDITGNVQLNTNDASITINRGYIGVGTSYNSSKSYVKIKDLYPRVIFNNSASTTEFTLGQNGTSFNIFPGSDVIPPLTKGILMDSSGNVDLKNEVTVRGTLNISNSSPTLQFSDSDSTSPEFRIVNDAGYTYFRTNGNTASPSVQTASWTDFAYFVHNTRALYMENHTIRGLADGTSSGWAVHHGQFPTRSDLTVISYSGSYGAYVTSYNTWYCTYFPGGTCVMYGWFGVKPKNTAGGTMGETYQHAIPNYGQTDIRGISVVPATAYGALAGNNGIDVACSKATNTSLNFRLYNPSGSFAAIGCYVTLYGTFTE